MPAQLVMGADWHAAGRLVRSHSGAALILMVAVFAACLFGIYTRPVGFLASVWPANAVMLGLLLRVPAASTPLGWLAGAAAYMAADMLTGSPLAKAAILNAANLAGIAAAYAIYAHLPAGIVRLKHPTSVLYLAVAAAVAGCVAGIVGGFANPFLFGGGIISGWTLWFATEFVNYIAFLPVILAMSSQPGPLLRRLLRGSAVRRGDLAPAAALLLTCFAAVMIGGPGALAIPVPALLWCGLVYAVFPTAVLTLLFGLWTLVAVSTGYLPNPAGTYDEMALISARFGASLVTLAPIMLSSVMQGRNELMARLTYLANHDALTGTHSRSAFLKGAGHLLERGRGPFAVLMIDLDHFKSINDRYGHADGDEVLVTFARRARSCLRPSDLLGRMGGEEFAVFIPGCSREAALAIAERIREAMEGAPVVLGDGREVLATASMGLAVTAGQPAAGMDRLLAAADAALYLAKNNGRNRVEHTVHEAGPQSRDRSLSPVGGRLATQG